MQVPVLPMCDDVFMNEGRCRRNQGTHKGCPYNITVDRGEMRW